MVLGKTIRNPGDRQSSRSVRTVLFGHLALSEIDLPSARQELRYAAPACERVLKRLSGADPVTRRRDIVLRALSRGA